MEDNRFKRAIRKMIETNEFDKIYDVASHVERKKVRLDTEYCKDLVDVNGATMPLLNTLKSNLVLKGIITYMNMEE